MTWKYLVSRTADRIEYMGNPRRVKFWQRVAGPQGMETNSEKCGVNKYDLADAI